ncbi:hypothetical protein CICLE_v10008333mg [Citrus x clementina]|uniref:FBD domain-containing protein n=3 Tax=Citrus TaxID=2706 RepID=A0ACB8P3D2_CITSI|nr:F-box/FBD/LRR-repeat protein At5g22700 [Citrus x clementina]ESR66164.1 hypothetical protein CICLE_v10008333mg [Citrus x clementina]KAH9804899.1 FBD domain-containing protein [Citrus sinensis]
MSKKARLSSSDDLLRENETTKDWVSQLPDDILINIISKLTLMEAARTCVLSSRWRYLWTFTTALDFDGIREILPRTKRYFREYKFVRWVNKVLVLHRGSNVSQFRVSFYLSSSLEGVITNWIYKALAKTVQNFELDFQYNSGHHYTFPQEIYNSLKGVRGLSSIKSLRSICLSAVNVTGEILEFFIHNCPLLDELCVKDSIDLVSLKVVGSSVRLNSLDIQYCSFMKDIEISTPNLFSFKYYGPKIELHIENVPQLVELSVRADHTVEDMFLVAPLVCYFPQLTMLELDSCNEVYKHFSNCELPKLIHLNLRVTIPNHECLVGLACIMKSCPSLQKLTLELQSSGRRIGKKTQQVPRCSHQHLKLVELHMFRGREIDLQLAFYIFENAAILGKMIVEPSNYMTRKEIRNCTQMLESKLPQGVELVIGSLYVSDYKHG